ncbi:MAG: hypothetical protein ACK44W_07050, partial [Planctomycetota bacterium]
MGKEIVYCHGCGKRLFEDDFARGRAHTQAYQHFCADCKPLPPSASTAGTRLRAPAPIPGPAKENRVPLRAWAFSRSSAPFAAGAIAGGAALIGLIVAASTVTGVVIKLPAGALSDLLGRKRVMLLGCLFFAVP